MAPLLYLLVVLHNLNNKVNPRLVIHRSASGLFLVLLRPYNYTLREHAYKRAVWTLLKHQRFDVIEAHDSSTLPTAVKLARVHHTPIVYDAVEITEHRTATALANRPWFVKRWEARRNQRLSKRAAVFLTVGPHHAQWYEEHYGRTTPVVIRNCRYYRSLDDIKRSTALMREEIHASDDHKLIVYCGSQTEDLGLETVIEGLTHLPDTYVLVSVGKLVPSKRIEYLRTLSDSLGVGNRTHFIDAKPPEDIIGYLSGADIGVIPFEGRKTNVRLTLPNRVFDMLMARLPMIVSDVPGTSSFVLEHNIGMVFQASDPRSLASTVVLLDKPAKYKSIKSNLLALAPQMSWEQEGRRYVDVINQVITAAQADWPRRGV